MKTLLFAVVAVLSFVTVAETAKPELTEAEKAAKVAAARQKMLEKTGGILDVPGQGKVVIVNCQKKIADKEIDEKMEQLKKVLRVGFDLRTGSWKMGEGIPADANVALFIVEDKSLPISLIAPEAKWGVLNVAEIDSGARFGKAFTRASILTFGAGVSQFKGSVMQTVTKPDDLDKILSDGVAFDALTSLMQNLKNIGVTQAKKTSYRKACMEGWAAAPTNDYQKVVWEEVHAKPTKPMKIKFDPKKGE